jgi:predicted anti-sigma-YlaC factor YlaD
MVHQPFEQWIVEQTPLTGEQDQLLQGHLQECSQCRELQSSLLTVDELLMQAPMAAPAAGFTRRWQASLAERRALQQRRQVRKFFLILLGAGLLTFGLLGLYVALTSSPVELVARLLENATRVLINLDQLESFVTAIFRTLPPYLSVGIWVLMASGLCLFTMIWIGALWRTSFQGVFHK